MTNYLKIYEVGPRDGLQNEAVNVATGDKLRLIDGLLAAGLKSLELTSFVHPKAVPQMADADEIMSQILANYQDPDLRFTGLVFNEKGYERAIATGAKAVAIGRQIPVCPTEKPWKWPGN